MQPALEATMADIETTTLPTPIPTALNVTALAKRFGVARTTIRRRLKKGWVPPTRVERKPRKAVPDALPSAHRPLHSALHHMSRLTHHLGAPSPPRRWWPPWRS